MAEANSFELMPYFMWKISDMSMEFESPIFSVNDVKFRMIYHRGDRTTALFMIPEVGDQQPFVPFYDFKTSTSIMDPDKSFEDLYYIQKKTNQNRSGRKMNHLIWEMENKILENLVMVQVEKGKKTVSFICVFGAFCVYRKDSANFDETWREFDCLERLGKDLNDLRLKEDSSSQLKCGDQMLNVHEVILSARSEKFANIFQNKKTTEKEVEITDMEFEVLENVITYIYSGRLKDSIPSVKLLKQLYEAAHEYKIESLKSMISFRLTEILVDAELSDDKKVGDKEKLSSSQEVGDEEKLSSSQEVGDEEKLSSSQEVVDKEKLSDSPYEMNKASLTEHTIYLLKQADAFKDESFKKSIILTIVHNNDFILNQEEWIDFRMENIDLAMQVYDVLVNDLL